MSVYVVGVRCCGRHGCDPSSPLVFSSLEGALSYVTDQMCPGRNVLFDRPDSSQWVTWRPYYQGEEETITVTHCTVL